MENNSRKISTKFNLAYRLLDQLNTYIDAEKKQQTYSGAGVDDLCKEVNAVESRYKIATANIFHKTSIGELGKAQASKEYASAVHFEDILGALDKSVNEIVARMLFDTSQMVHKPRSKSIKIEKYGHTHMSKDFNYCVHDLVKQYWNLQVDLSHKAEAGDSAKSHWCEDCECLMDLTFEQGEAICPECGEIRYLSSHACDDAQGQDGQKSKSGSFNPNRHFHFWMDRILARESEEELGDKDDPNNTCGEKLFTQLKAIVKRDRKILRLLTVDDVRSMLKEIDRTDLNKNVPTIMRRLTGVGPPNLSEMVCQRVEYIFSKAIALGETVKSSIRTNRNYYPYYIYKILEAVLDKNNSDDRRVLSYIYMQGQETLDKNDKEWEKICGHLNIKWVPTKRSKSQKIGLL